MELDSDIDVLAVNTIRRAIRGTQTIVAWLPMNITRKVLEKQLVRIRWVNCQVREK